MTHYSVSLLIGYKPLGLRNALLFALVGLLPDIDAIFRVHRWFTHSLVFFVGVMLVLLALRPNRLLALGGLLYGLHILVDLFTAPTPILYPFSGQALWVRVGLDVSIGATVGLKGWLSFEWVSAEFEPRVLEGPLISDVGLAVALGVLVFLALDRVWGR